MVFSNSLRSVFRTLSNINDGAFSENGCLTGRSHPEVFCEKSLLKNFVKFTGKDLCQSLFLNKVAGQACEFCGISKKHLFLKNTFGGFRTGF